MSSGQIQPERTPVAKPRNSPIQISGRAWVKRDLDFWHRCTVEHYTADGVKVAMDNLDELTVDPDDVAQFDLEPGRLVFFRHWEGSISGFPGFIVSVKRETAELDFPSAIYGENSTPSTTLLRELRVYRDVPTVVWKPGVRVFAYKAIPFDWVYKAIDLKPKRFLLFPARVLEIRYDACIVVEFGDGEVSFVPATLVELLQADPGEMVYACTSYVSHGTNPVEEWTPCRIVSREGENLVLQDGTGDRFESKISMIAILPKGYHLCDGKFEKISHGPALHEATEQGVPTGDVHIVRTDHWEDAADDPITKQHIDALIASDPDLAWSTPEWHGMSDDDDAVIRRFSILWKGQPCFGWHRSRISGVRPDEEQLAKMIEIAIELDANVVGEDGEEYH